MGQWLTYFNTMTSLDTFTLLNDNLDIANPVTIIPDGFNRITRLKFSFGSSCNNASANTYIYRLSGNGINREHTFVAGSTGTGGASSAGSQPSEFEIQTNIPVIAGSNLTSEGSVQGNTTGGTMAMGISIYLE